jgi:hypothetical protein
VNDILKPMTEFEFADVNMPPLIRKLVSTSCTKEKADRAGP